MHRKVSVMIIKGSRALTGRGNWGEPTEQGLEKDRQTQSSGGPNFRNFKYGG